MHVSSHDMLLNNVMSWNIFTLENVSILDDASKLDNVSKLQNVSNYTM